MVLLVEEIPDFETLLDSQANSGAKGREEKFFEFHFRIR